MRTLGDRLWSKVAIGGWDECWPWTGGVNRPGGYGRIRGADGCLTVAHRVAYELLVGPIPNGLTIDHVKKWGCTDTLCCNPLHLEATTMAENIARGSGCTAPNLAKMECPAGHPYDEQNTYDGHRGWRECRACNREAQRRSRARRRAQ